jgi:MFS family permease
MVCTNKETLGLFGALMLAGLFVGSIFLVRLGDIFGRKKMLFVVVTFSSLTLLLMLMINNLAVLLICIFIFGMTASPRYALSFVYALELTTSDHEAFYSMLSMICDSSGLIVLGTYFYFVKDINAIL